MNEHGWAAIILSYHGLGTPTTEIGVVRTATKLEYPSLGMLQSHVIRLRDAWVPWRWRVARACIDIMNHDL